MLNIRKTTNKLPTLYNLASYNYSTIITNRNSAKILSRPHQNSLFRLPQRFFCNNESDSDVLTLSEEQINELTKGSEELTHKLKVLLLETEVMRQEGKCVPSQDSMNMQHWKELLERESRSGRRKYLEFLFKIEKKKENRIVKKEQRKLERTEREPLVDDGSMRYDLGHNNMFLRIYDSTINRLYNSALINAMKFSQKIVIDCGYHQQMTKRENVNCAKQLMLVFADNRNHQDPFDIHFCNLQKNSQLEDYLHRFIPTMYDAEFPFNVHETSYLDHFPKEKIVYLTPHCREELKEFDHDAVYVIGAIVDKVNNEPLSMAKAKREGLKMAKFPLDKYLTWGSGSGKSLTINQVVSIMLDLRMKGDWAHALRHVPKRKIAHFGMEEENMNQSVSSTLRRNNFQRNSYDRGFSDSFRYRESRYGDSDNRYVKKNSNWRPNPKSSNDEVTSQRLIHLKNILKE